MRSQFKQQTQRANKVLRTNNLREHHRKYKQKETQTNNINKETTLYDMRCKWTPNALQI